MKHFTKKLALLTLLAGLCGSAWAQVTTWTATNTSYSSSQELSTNLNVVSVKLGAGSWFYDTGRKGITTTKTQAPTTNGNIPTEGTYFVIKPTKDISFIATSYSSISNCNVVLYDESGNKLKDFRQKGDNTNDYGKLSSGKTYYLYGTSFKAQQALDNLYLKAFTATSYENYIITYKLSDGTEIKNPVSNSALYGTTVSANSDEAIESIEYNGTSYFLTSGNEAITLTDNVNQNVINLIYEEITPGYITINYISETGTVLKDPVTVSGIDGTEYTVPAENIPTYLTLDEVKYKYSNGNETLTFSSDEAQTIDLIYSEAQKYTYIVKAVSGSEVLKIIETNDVYEGESVTVAYPQYVLSGTTLYNIANNGSGDWYRISFTPTEDNYTKELSYTNGTVDNVVFYTEAEDIEGVATASYTNRASNGTVARATESKSITTLEPGKYKIFVRGLNGNQNTRTANFYLNDATDAVFTFGITNGTNQTGNSEEFTVAEPSELSFTCEGSSSSGLDWLYIVKTGDVVTVPGTLKAGKYATRIFPFVPTVPSGVQFYSCTALNGNSLALNEVSAPEANTPYILENKSGADIDITQTGVDTHEADTYEAGLLTGVFADKVITSGYVLQTQGEKQSFYKVANDNPITVPPYRAYLNYSAGVKSIGFDTTTAINTLEVLTSGAYEGIYTVDGVKLNRIEKGVNILKMADGTTRKVVVK